LSESKGDLNSNSSGCFLWPGFRSLPSWSKETLHQTKYQPLHEFIKCFQKAQAESIKQGMLDSFAVSPVSTVINIDYRNTLAVTEPNFIFRKCFGRKL